MNGYADYNQIAIALQDIYKTAFSTPWSTFVCMVRLLCNVPATFQRLVMYIFIDDFSTQSISSQHLGYVREF